MDEITIRDLIYIGDISDPAYVFTDNEIVNINVDTAVSLIGEELAADTLAVTVRCSDSDILSLQYGTIVTYYRDDAVYAKMYFTKATRLSSDQYELDATSLIGLLDLEPFYGGLYNGATFRQAVEEIIGTNGLQRYARLSPVYTSYKTFKPSFASIANTYMNYRLKAKFKFNKFDPVTYLSSKTSIRAVPIGTYIDPQYSSYFDYGNYCIYADFTRASTSDPWPQTAEFFFCYGDQVFSLGTPALGTQFNIDVNPGLGRAIINGVTYQIQAGSSSKQTMLQTWGSGFSLWGGTQTSYCYCYLELGEMEVYDGSGNLVFKPEYIVERPLVDNGERKAHIIDTVTYSMSTGVSGISGDFSESDLPGFVNKTDLQIQIINSIRYDENIENLPIYGHLPICTKREALYQLLFANGINLVKATDGDILFSALYDTDPTQIPDDRLYMGGSVETYEDIREIELKEYQYELLTPSAAMDVYDNTSGSALDKQIAVFDRSPCKYASATGLTVYAYNINAAIASGIGTISAQPFPVSESIIRRTVTDNPTGRTVSVSDATLITMRNSEVVADRLQNYYKTASKIKQEILLLGEKCGFKYSFINPFGELASAFLSKMSLIMSSKIKASCEFIAGYVPEDYGAGYTDCIILEGSGTWEVPASVFEHQNPRIRVILVGGGTGGDSGYAGKDGSISAVNWVEIPANEGGATGEGGEGGKILTVVIDNPSASYDYSCGIGGPGGAECSSHTQNNPGSPGTDTTFSDGETTYSSASGTRKDEGIALYDKGVVLGNKNQEIPVAGGSSGYATISPDGIRVYDGEYIYHNTLHGGTQGTAAMAVDGLIATGGMGGGAAYYKHGKNGGDATKTGNYSGIAGNGGNGSDATAETRTFYYGKGGKGGHGGGGGGSTGTGSANCTVTPGSAAGRGGKGSPGCTGGSGCIAIYY